jgi:hypothetical protein
VQHARLRLTRSPFARRLPRSRPCLLVSDGRSVHAIEARLTKADGVVFTSESWTVGTREISGTAEEIARCLPRNLVNPEILKQRSLFGPEGRVTATHSR